VVRVLQSVCSLHLCVCVSVFVAACRDMFVFVGHAGNKIDEVWQQIYLEEGSSERDEILQVARGGLVYPTIHTGDHWPRESS